MIFLALRREYHALHVKIKNWFMVSVQISSYGCTQEVSLENTDKPKSYSRRGSMQM